MRTLLAILIVTAANHPASAAISILTSNSLAVYPDASNAVTGTFDMSASSSSVLLFAVANSGTIVNNTFTASSNSITSTALTRLTPADSGDGSVGFYILDRSTGGTTAEQLTWNMNSGGTYLDRVSVQVFQLAGVDMSQAAIVDLDRVNGGNPLTVTNTLPLLADTEYAVFTVGNGRKSNAAGIGPAGDAASWTYAEVDNPLTGGNRDGHGVAYNLSVSGGVNSTPGIQFTSGDTGSNKRAVASVAFTAIPEPASLVLLGLGGLCLLGGRQRSV